MTPDQAQRELRFWFFAGTVFALIVLALALYACFGASQT